MQQAGEALPDGLASVVAKLDNLAAGKPPSPAELEPFRSAASAKLQEDIQRANLTLGGPKGIPNSTLTRDELISGLPAGTKITPESVVDIRKLPDGRTVWLETGSDAAGLQHIYKRHEVDCRQQRNLTRRDSDSCNERS